MLCFIRKTTILNTLALVAQNSARLLCKSRDPRLLYVAFWAWFPHECVWLLQSYSFLDAEGLDATATSTCQIVDLRFWKGHTQVSPKCLIIGCWLVSFNDSRNRNMSLHILIASPHVIFCGWTSGWIFLGAFQACAAVACVHAVLSVVSCVCCVVWHKWPHFMKRPRSQGLEHLYKQIISVASVAWRFLSTTKIHPSRN